MRGKIAWLKLPVRHRTLAPFDGITRIRFKGSSNWTSQPLRLPRLVEMRLKPDPGKSTRRQIANHSARRPTNLESLGCRGRLLDVRVKDRLPFTLPLLFLPDGGSVVGTGLVLPIVCAFDRHLVGCDNCVRFIGRDFVVADRERFHVPFLHVRQFFLQVGRAFSVNTYQLGRNDLLEVVGLSVLERLPCGFLFFHHRVFSRRGGRQSNRSKQCHHCVADIFFHYVLSLRLGADHLVHSTRPSRAIGALSKYALQTFQTVGTASTPAVTQSSRDNGSGFERRLSCRR